MRTNGSDDPASGLTKREYAAIHMMAAMLSDSSDHMETQQLAFIAAGAADALFDELAK